VCVCERVRARVLVRACVNGWVGVGGLVWVGGWVGVGAYVRVGECETGGQCAEAADAQGSCAQIPAFCWPPRPAKYGSYRRLAR
jgi:hypothetical protein